MNRAYEWLARACLALACLGLAGIVALYSIEVVARYFFDAPSTWIADMVTYLQCAVVFLALPYVTRAGDHIRLEFGIPAQDDRSVSMRARICAGLACAVCLVSAFLCGRESWRQFENGITTMSALAVPQWMVSGFMAFGLACAAAAFILNVLDPKPRSAAVSQ